MPPRLGYEQDEVRSRDGSVFDERQSRSSSADGEMRSRSGSRGDEARSRATSPTNEGHPDPHDGMVVAVTPVDSEAGVTDQLSRPDPPEKRRISLGKMQRSGEMGEDEKRTSLVKADDGWKSETEAAPILPDSVVGSHSCHGVDRNQAKSAPALP